MQDEGPREWNGFGRNACNVICNTSGYIASTPRLAERCGRLSAGVPSRHARENALLASAQLSGRPFFGVTMFASSRFFSARDNHDLELSERLLRLNYAGFKS